MNYGLLQNSLLTSGLTTLLSVSAGFMAALWLECLERQWRRRLLALALVALVLPPFLVTNCWLDLVGANGLLSRWLPLNLYSVGGTVCILTLLTWPITLLAAVSAWRRVDASQIESDTALGGWALIRWLLWPAARGAVGIAAVVTFVLALNNFSVPTILQVKVFPAEAWMRYYNQMDFAGTLAVSWPLILAPLVVIALLQRAEVAWPAQESPATARALRRQLGAGWFGMSRTMGIILLAISVGLPLGQLLIERQTWTELPNLLLAVPGTIWNSFSFAVLGATVCIVLGVVSWRLPAGAWLWLPFLAPGVLLSIGLIYVFNRPGLDAIYHSTIIVVLAWTLRYLAIGWQGAARAMRGVDPDLTDAARLEGAGVWALWRYVHWPQIAPRLSAAWYLTYLLCLWDVETLILIMPPGGETLALRIFNLLHYGHHAQVNGLCLLLLGLALLPMALLGLARWKMSNVQVFE